MSGFLDTGPATRIVDIIPDDDTDIEIPRSVWVGTAGTVKVMNIDGTIGTITNAPGGILLPYRPKRVLATGTTASDISAWY